MKCLAKACGDRETLCPAIYHDGKRCVVIGKTGSFKTLPPEITLNWDEDYVTIPTSLLIEAARAINETAG